MTALFNRNDLAEELFCLQNDDKDTLPMDTENMNTLPMDTENMNTLPMDTENMNTLPMDTENMNTLPMDTENMNTLPMDTENMNTLPMDTENMNLSYKNTYNVFKNVDGLKFMHINITTLLPKIDEIKHLLIDLKVDIISLNETRLDKRINVACLNIDGYSLYRNDHDRHGGGVALYIRETLSPDKYEFDYKCESLWVKFKVNSKLYIVGSIYRPPSSLVEYDNFIVQDIEKASSCGHEIIILGDLNYHYDPSHDIYHNKGRYLESLFDLKQLITETTRQTEYSSSCIDLIYVCNTLYTSCTSSGVFEVTLSDHFPVFVIMRLPYKTLREPRIIKLRNFKKFDQNQFVKAITDSIVLNDFYSCVDVNDSKVNIYLFVINLLH